MTWLSLLSVMNCMMTNRLRCRSTENTSITSMMCITTLKEAISDLFQPYRKFIELATTIPGITENLLLLLSLKLG